MKNIVKRVVGVYFSPTGNTERQVRSIVERLGKTMGVTVGYEDITPYASRQREPLRFGDDELAVVGFPTYAGRLPNKIVPDVTRLLIGAKTPLVALVTFGNRAFENSLAELVHLLESNGFCTVGAIAIACKHAFAKIGPEQPTEQTKTEISTLVESVVRGLTCGGSSYDCKAEISCASKASFMPGDAKAPYYVPKGADGKVVNFLKAKPRTDKAKCNGCGLCANLCPMQAINFNTPHIIEGTCIKCHSCVVRCPQGAKFFNDEQFHSHKQYLEQNYKANAKSESFGC